MVEHAQTIRRQQFIRIAWVCFDQFVELALKRLKKITYQKFLENFIRRLTIIILQANTQRAETLKMNKDLSTLGMIHIWRAWKLSNFHDPLPPLSIYVQYFPIFLTLDGQFQINPASHPILSK